MDGSKKTIVYYVYILQSRKNGKLYIGQTNNIDRRVEDHNTGLGGKYTRQNSPWILVHSEQHPNRVSAVRRERYLKSTRGSQEKKQLAGIVG
jgi:putative endonuclease